MWAVLAWMLLCFVVGTGGHPSRHLPPDVLPDVFRARSSFYDGQAGGLALTLFFTGMMNRPGVSGDCLV